MKSRTGIKTAGRRRSTSLIIYCLTLVAIVSMVLVAEEFGLNDRADMQLSARRMELASRPATGDVVLVAIDKRSLDAIGVWPWPRSVYASIIDRLIDAGTGDIFFDIDFSARSNSADDRIFLEALKRAGGGIVLPTFQQHMTADNSNDAQGITQPLPDFAANAWLASVNVKADHDGIVRVIPYGNGLVASVPATLAGGSHPSLGDFAVDFSIGPATVPVISVIDLIEGKVDAAALANRSVVVGASAIELKDNFNVPVHGLITGPMLQIIGTETLLQDRVLGTLSSWPMLILALVVGSFVLLSDRRALTYMALLLAASASAEALAFWMQTANALVMPTASSHFLLILFGATRILNELDLRKLLIRIASAEAKNSRSILDQVISDSADAVLILDEDWAVLDCNQRFKRLLTSTGGLKKGETALGRLPPVWINEIGNAVETLRAVGTVEPHLAEIVIETADSRRIVEYSITPSRLSGVDAREGHLVSDQYVVCLTARDITERRLDEDRILYLSRHDVLTGALRASAFINDLQPRLEYFSRSDLGLAVYAVNLHRFKTINTTLGRAKGDAILRAAVERLDGLGVGLSPTARLGGDTFALYPLEAVDRSQAEMLAQKIVDALSVPYELSGFKARLGAHIGMTFKPPSHSSTAAQVVAEAELALEDARRTSGNGIAHYDPALGAHLARNSEIESELWKALEKDQISVLYQPQLDLSSRTVHGAEALIRWTHPEFGKVSPAIFIEIAEANGFVEQLGNWVLLQACRDAMTWCQPIRVAVNVSPLQFVRGDIISAIVTALESSGLPPARLQVEITESTFLDKSDMLIEKLNAIKALGVSLALDDFGTGYSSFGYLARFPLDKIKVDQMFIRTLIESQASQAVVRSVKALADGLGIRTICEGIETEAEAAMLIELGCAEGQGYLFGRPMTSENLDLFSNASNGLITPRIAGRSNR